MPARVWNWPVLPVMPWVMTLVSLVRRMLIASLALYRRDDFLRRVRHVRSRDDRQTGIGEYLLAEIDVGAFEAHDERHLEAHLPRGRDHAFGDHVALHDAAEDVDEDRLEVRV